MRLIYCSPYFDPAVPSGANRRFLELVERFDRQFGSDFELIIAEGKKPAGIKNAVVSEIKYRPKSILSKISAWRQIARVLDSREPSIFINEFLPVPFRSASRHKHFQVVYDLRYFTDNMSLPYRLRYVLPLKREWFKSQYLVTCSDFSKSEIYKYIGREPRDIITSYFGIDKNLLSEGDSPSETKDIDILFVGHFEKRKNHSNLIKALSLVDKNLKVKLIGVDNGLKDENVKLAKNLGLRDIEFFTLNSDRELWQYYRRARLFVFPSHYEGFGIPLIEALALGTPVACSDIPVFREIGGSLPAFFDQNDPQDMAQKIKKCLDSGDPPDRQAVRRQLRQFLWDEIYEKFVSDVFSFL